MTLRECVLQWAKCYELSAEDYCTEEQRSACDPNEQARAIYGKWMPFLVLSCGPAVVRAELSISETCSSADVIFSRFSFFFAVVQQLLLKDCFVLSEVTNVHCQNSERIRISKFVLHLPTLVSLAHKPVE